MARKNENPHKTAMREIMRGNLKENDISIINKMDVNAVMRDIFYLVIS